VTTLEAVDKLADVIKDMAEIIYQMTLNMEQSNIANCSVVDAALLQKMEETAEKMKEAVKF
jgi:uncharacterized iron-regulated protein